MAKITFQYTDKDLRLAVPAMSRKMDRALKATMDFHAAEGTKYMKEHAPWTDRTTNARNGLHAVTSSQNPGFVKRLTGKKQQYEITFAHTVHYGIWLEIANSGRYQIIMPTVRHEGDLLMQRLRGLLPRLESSAL